MVEFTQGVCQDGAAILKDGKMLTIEEILEHLRGINCAIALENSQAKTIKELMIENQKLNERILELS